MAGWRLEHTYAELPPILHAPASPTPVRDPHLLILNWTLAETLGLEPRALEGDAGARLLAGNQLPDGARPLAQAYAGHQFGHFTALGDGRAILLGEQVTPTGGRADIQLKGAGRTAFSRRGDGRAALGPMLREFIVSEAMAALGIPTSRSLAVTLTGEPVHRERVLEGAVLTRIAASHIRVGTFQWAAAHQDVPALRALAEYTRQRHYGDVPSGDALALFDAIADRQARLIAQWQAVGFIHGVMNTDNMALSGETLDYGPCAFMDRYDPDTVFSSIDTLGRYAYGNQPSIARWNLARLAEAMLPLFATDTDTAVAHANDSLKRFEERVSAAWLHRMRAKLGLVASEPDDQALVDDLLAWMQERRADFTNTFVALTNGERPAACAARDEAFDAWHARWTDRRSRQPLTVQEWQARMRAHNPLVIPRNHRVEAVLAAATNEHDLAPLHELLAVVDAPYDYDRTRPAESLEPAPPDQGYRTFCGT
jgi:uncharacterized protein YdiU (UPF0061 family)